MQIFGIVGNSAIALNPELIFNAPNAQYWLNWDDWAHPITYLTHFNVCLFAAVPRLFHISRINRKPFRAITAIRLVKCSINRPLDFNGLSNGKNIEASRIFFVADCIGSIVSSYEIWFLGRHNSKLTEPFCIWGGFSRETFFCLFVPFLFPLDHVLEALSPKTTFIQFIYVKNRKPPQL